MNSNHNSVTAQSAMRLPIVDDSPARRDIDGFGVGVFPDSGQSVKGLLRRM